MSKDFKVDLNFICWWSIHCYVIFLKTLKSESKIQMCTSKEALPIYTMRNDVLLRYWNLWSNINYENMPSYPINPLLVTEQVWSQK